MKKAKKVLMSGEKRGEARWEEEKSGRNTRGRLGGRKRRGGG